MSGLVDVVDALADQIKEALAGFEYGVQVQGRYVINPSPPTIDIYPGDPERGNESEAFGDIGGEYRLTVRARIGTADYDAGYDFLLALMDDDDDLSLAQAIFDDPTLNGYATTVDVREQSGLRAYEHPSGEGALLGFQLTVIVIAAHS